MRKITLRKRTPNLIEEIELEVSRSIILRDGIKELVIELPTEEEKEIAQQLNQLHLETQQKEKNLLQKIKEILPLPKR